MRCQRSARTFEIWKEQVNGHHPQLSTLRMLGKEHLRPASGEGAYRRGEMCDPKWIIGRERGAVAGAARPPACGRIYYLVRRRVSKNSPINA